MVTPPAFQNSTPDPSTIPLSKPCKWASRLLAVFSDLPFIQVPQSTLPICMTAAEFALEA